MKKIVYQTPEVKVKALVMDYLLEGSIKGTGPDIDLGYNPGDGSLVDPDAKDGIESHSVWDD